MNVYTCPKCAQLFKVIYLSRTFPGGKERESIDCPDCGTNVSSEVTSAVLSNNVLDAIEKVGCQAELSCHTITAALKNRFCWPILSERVPIIGNLVSPLDLPPCEIRM